MAGSRKEYELLFKLQASLGGNFNAAFKNAVNTTRQLQNTMQKLNSTAGKIEAFKKQETALESNRQKLEKLTAEHDRLQQEINQTEQPSEKMRAAMERNERQIAETTAKIEQQENRLRTLGDQLSDAGVDTSRLTEENERLAKSYERLKSGQEELARLNGAIQQNNEAISQTKAQLGGTIGTIAALGAAIYAGPIKKSAELEAQMSSVKSLIAKSYGDNTEQLAVDMERLNSIAKEMGATTKYTAVEAGKAIEYMGMAGWTADKMIEGLPGIMNLAAASGEDLGAVSDIVTDALTAFRMGAGDAERFANVLAQASSNANTNVGMMGATFQKVAPVAGALGYSVEDMSLAIGLMANASIKADVAGTSLKTSLANMAKPTKQMKSYMDQYGISLTRSDGSMKTFREVADNLRSSLGGLSEAEQVAAATAIFGKESFAGMLAIVNASDEDYQKLAEAINNSKDAAAEMAKIKQDNLEGDIEILKSAFDALQTAIGDELRPAMRDAVQGVTSIITTITEFISKNPELVRQIVKITAGFLGFKAAALTAKLGFLELKGGVLTVQKGFVTLQNLFNLASVNSRGFSGTLKGVAKSITGYFGGIGNAAGGVGHAFTQLFSGTKIGNLFSGGGGLLSKAFSGIEGLASGAAGKATSIFAKAGSAIAAGPLGKIGSVVGKGFSKLTNLIAPLQKLGGAILGPFGGIAGKILPVVGVIGLIIAAVQIFRDHLDDIRNLIERVFGPAGVEVFDNIVGVITNIGETIKGIFSGSNLASAREFINGIFGEQGVAVFNTFASIMQTVGGVIGQFISFIDTSVKPVITGLFDFIVKTVLPQIAQAFVEWGPQIISIIQNIWQNFQVVASAVISVIQFLMPTIQSLVGTGLETVRSVVSGVLTAIQGLLQVFSGIFTGNWTQIWTGVQNIFSGIWESIGGIARGALNGIIDIVNGLIGGLNKLKIPDWVPVVGGQGIDIPLIPKFAKGTPRTPDTFIAGEKGAELITNARNRTVFTAAETGNIFANLAGMAKTMTGNAGLQMIPTFAKGTARTPDTFIAGEAGAELITNARNRTVFNAIENGNIFTNLVNVAKTFAGNTDIQQYRMTYAGAEAPNVNPPTLETADRQTSIVIHSAPVFHVGSEAQAQDIEEILRKHDEELLQEIDDRERRREDDERRLRYD